MQRTLKQLVDNVIAAVWLRLSC